MIIIIICISLTSIIMIISIIIIRSHFGSRLKGQEGSLQPSASNGACSLAG
jgi:hypothetical protein